MCIICFRFQLDLTSDREDVHMRRCYKNTNGMTENFIIICLAYPLQILESVNKFYNQILESVNKFYKAQVKRYTHTIWRYTHTPLAMAILYILFTELANCHILLFITYVRILYNSINYRYFMWNLVMKINQLDYIAKPIC